MAEKLVRDKIVEIKKEQGETPEYFEANRKEFITKYLPQKILEEAKELASLLEQAGQEEDFEGYLKDKSLLLYEEEADLQQVLADIRDMLNMEKMHVDVARIKKHQKKGGFTKGIILITPEEISGTTNSSSD